MATLKRKNAGFATGTEDDPFTEEVSSKLVISNLLLRRENGLMVVFFLQSPF